MSVAVNVENKALFRLSTGMWITIAILLMLTMIPFGEGIEFMVMRWLSKDEYSHGILIPPIFGFLIWQKRYELARMPFTGSWYGVLLILAGWVGYAVGELSSLYSIIQYSFLLVVYGFFLACMGWHAFKLILMPLLILLFMIPLPNFLYNNLSSQLQLISSSLGVDFIRLFGISVYLEGNVIDLGAMRLEVVEACNGLRYLFPLMTLGFIMAYFYHDKFWKRATLFLSSIPITILMNSLRIGIIGCTVEYFGQDAAEGVLHFLEGWVVFMASLGVMLLEVWVLSIAFAKHKRPYAEVMGLDIPVKPPAGIPIKFHPIPKQFWFGSALVMAGLIVGLLLPHRSETVPQREPLDLFPLKLNDWRGRPEILEQMYIDSLKFDDYLLANYRNGVNMPVNLYVAYYNSQRKGASVHSPKSCIPGGGWSITDFSRRTLDGISVYGQPLNVNRAVIQLGDNRQIVYYWFQQRGRIVTDEYLAKWYIFWDALTRNRTDGALVRLTVMVPAGQDVEAADRLLTNFAAAAVPQLEAHIPE
jgi:exosortase D (VPLPA-CTERM-specific)